MLAVTGEPKKNHTWAPFPDRERSTAHGTPRLRQVAALLALSGCATIRAHEAATTERLLAAAGFQMRPAESPERVRDLATMPPLKVVEDNLIVDGNKCLIRALAALDFRQLADAPYELVRACGRVPTLAGLLADEPGGENVLAAPEELSEQPDLF